jgi:hypothetical protein
MREALFSSIGIDGERDAGYFFWAWKVIVDAQGNTL